ncbi:MAG: 2-acyl-glycerophospho-ethanolamine acyltransferase [Syntrophaceae bacterium PtaB.Bin038]|jgi:1-acyl-sn-glycerol-3-phosphate acyltransferase|nr:MAG: 2-acyl-glycerophospho-ethanolamine acyltransferase [Syntrophaceae bacterium PtaB.Bin038]
MIGSAGVEEREVRTERIMNMHDQKWLAVQNALSRLAAFLYIPLVVLAIRLMGYRFRDLRAFRRRCRDHFSRHDGGWLICANHLTLVDSAFIAYAMLPPWRYLFSYRWLPWNLPERRNFNRNPLDTTLCYLTKCIPVTRGGDREGVKRTLEKCDRLLATGHTILVFPEGGRSRTGRIDTENFAYGVGRFVKNLDRMKILCVYLRGDGQETWSSIPKRGDTFTMDAEVFEPERLAYNGLKAQRDYAGQIIRQLSRMEERYFESRERHRRLDGTPQQGKEPGLPVHQPGVHLR